MPILGGLPLQCNDKSPSACNALAQDSCIRVIGRHASRIIFFRVVARRHFSVMHRSVSSIHQRANEKPVGAPRGPRRQRGYAREVNGPGEMSRRRRILQGTRYRVGFFNSCLSVPLRKIARRNATRARKQSRLETIWES